MRYLKVKYLFFMGMHNFFYANDLFLYTRKLSAPPIQLAENEKVIVYSPFRTGSTLVYNILNYLCEDQTENSGDRFNKRVIKTHYPQHKRYFNHLKERSFFGYVFVTIRHPKEAVVSYCNLVDIYERGKALEAINLMVKQYKILKKFVSKDRDGLEVTVLRYEEFNDHLESILVEIERVFRRAISKEERKEIFQLFNRIKMKERSENLGSWKSFDPETELRGGHVDKRRNRYVLSSSFQKILSERLELVITLWGYRS